MMRTIVVIVFLLAFAFCAGSTVLGGAPTITMSTTTSTENSGLLDVILPEFEKDTGIRVKVLAKGTGAALRDGMDGNVDVVFVHAREREEEFVEQGYGAYRLAVMHNDFVIAGPAADPAGIEGTTDAVLALRNIAEAKALFVSRGDDSGTHTKEKSLWEQAGITPEGEWYLSLGQGMGETLTFANESGAYTLTDRGTFLSQSGTLPNLKVVVGGQSIDGNQDPALLNPYGVIPVNPDKSEAINAELAEAFVNWMTSASVQEAIAEFGIDTFGQPLFYPNASN